MARRCRKHAHPAGYSLVELMVVVVITGILAAIAIPTFTSYIMKSRTSEAVQFLGVIKLREEAYRSEFGRYACTFNGCYGNGIAAADYQPPIGTNPGKPVSFPSAIAEWNQLGAKPDGFVRFRYEVLAGPPGTAAGTTLLPGWSGDHWFLGSAVADLDANGAYCTFEMYSESKSIWVSTASGWD
jgi:prepilin-type N-terminal cleavage/methylation domain-containing protein